MSAVLLMVGVGAGPRVLRPGLRRHGLEPLLLDRVRVMALGADPPALLAALCPTAYPLAVDAVPPVAVDLSVALAAELLGLVEADLAAPVVYERVPVPRVMAVKAPDRAPAVLEVHRVGHYVLVHGQRPGVLARGIGHRRAVVARGARHEVLELACPGLHHGLFMCVVRFYRHLAHGLGAVIGVAKPEHAACLVRALHVGKAGCRFGPRYAGVAFPALKAIRGLGLTLEVLYVCVGRLRWRGHEEPERKEGGRGHQRGLSHFNASSEWTTGSHSLVTPHCSG